MLVVTLTSLLAFILVILDSRKVIDFGLKGAFIITSVIIALHYDYGNDYMMYYRRYINALTSGYSAEDFITKNLIRNGEFGWSLINMLFMPFGRAGFFVMVAALGCFQNWVYYRMIKKYLSRDWWWLGVFTYLFMCDFYLLSFSLMRQGLAMTLFFLMCDWIYERKIILSVLGALALTTIHASSMVVFPFLFWGFIPQKSGKVCAIAFGVLFLILFMSRNIVDNIFAKMITVEVFGGYNEEYSNEQKQTSFGMGFILNLMAFVTMLYYLYTKKNISRRDMTIVCMNCVAYLIIPFTTVIQLIARMSYYFSIYSILSLPIAYRHVRSGILRESLIFIYMFMTLVGYIGFFSNPIWVDDYTYFQTIFSAL